MLLADYNMLGWDKQGDISRVKLLMDYSSINDEKYKFEENMEFWF